MPRFPVKALLEQLEIDGCVARMDKQKYKYWEQCQYTFIPIFTYSGLRGGPVQLFISSSSLGLLSL